MSALYTSAVRRTSCVRAADISLDISYVSDILSWGCLGKLERFLQGVERGAEGVVGVFVAWKNCSPRKE